MSVVTTQPEMLTSVPSMADARLLAGGSHDYPDGAGMGGDRRVERRRNGGPVIHRWTS